MFHFYLRVFGISVSLVESLSCVHVFRLVSVSLSFRLAWTCFVRLCCASIDTCSNFQPSFLALSLPFSVSFFNLSPCACVLLLISCSWCRRPLGVDVLLEFPCFLRLFTPLLFLSLSILVGRLDPLSFGSSDPSIIE